MSRQYATQCPACKARFQVTLDQLNKAQGLVRCGACLHVFPADQHLETAPEDHAMPAPIRSPSTPQPRSHIPDIPMQLQMATASTSAAAYLGWSTLTLAAIVALGLQVLWFERDQLSRTPQLQAIYAKACQHLDCQLPARQDLPSIRNHQLIVRDHPQYQGALMIDLLIENEAPFAQPFPALQLIFSSLNGAPRAARAFQPREYLGGDFSPHQLMPSGRQIRVNLEILNPGSLAPNYVLNIIPARRASSTGQERQPAPPR